MLPEDTYRKRQNGFKAELEAWAKAMADCAEIAHGPVGDGWQISTEPHAATACPFQIVMRPDQKFDALVGGVMYEDLSMDHVDLPAIVRGIAEGRVLIRRWSSAATGLQYGVETIVDLGSGEKWRVQRQLPGVRPTEDEELMACPVAFAPYRR